MTATQRGPVPTMSAAARALSRPPAAPVTLRTSGRFRPDVEGLRAVAIVLVVLGHAGVPGFAGGYVGVDVFFVISGFLITSLLAREVRHTGRIAIGRFYARRVLRLLPAAALVSLVTLVGAWLWLTPIRLREFAYDAIASAFYVSNIRFAATGTDYLNADATPSPFRHFWSLGVEEQFYLVWPLLLAGTVALGGYAAGRRRVVPAAPERRAGLGGWTVAALVLLTAGSFWLGVTETARSAPWAYLGSHTRAWELGVGALLALSLRPLGRLPGKYAVGLGWAGLAAILAAAVAYDGATAFPGTAALLPVLGAAAVIAAGVGHPDRGLAAQLGRAPLQAVGRVSYGWYLWHWPVLLIVPAALGAPRDPTDTGVVHALADLALCVGAFGLAVLTYHLVENPIRQRRALRTPPARGIALGLGLSTVVAVAALLAVLLPPTVDAGGTVADARSAVAETDDPARAMADLVRRSSPVTRLPANLVPALDRAERERPAVYENGCHADLPATDVPGDCAFGALDSPTTVVLFGDSHAAQWFPALRQIAEQRRWRLVSLTKSACPAAQVLVREDTLKRAYTECRTWRDAALRRIGELRPALVVVSSGTGYTLAGAGVPADRWRGGWSATLGKLSGTGARIAAILDTPMMAAPVPACLAEHPDRIGRCALPRGEALTGTEQRTVAAEAARTGGATTIDPIPWLCDATCPAVLGNLLAYRDSHHLTTVLAELLAPPLAARLPALR